MHTNYLENTPGLLVDETTDALDTTPPCKSANGRLGDSLRKHDLNLIHNYCNAIQNLT